MSTNDTTTPVRRRTTRPADEQPTEPAVGPIEQPAPDLAAPAMAMAEPPAPPAEQPTNFVGVDTATEAADPAPQTSSVAAAPVVPAAPAPFMQHGGSAESQLVHRFQCPTALAGDATRIEQHNRRHGPRTYRIERCCDCGAQNTVQIGGPPPAQAGDSGDFDYSE